MVTEPEERLDLSGQCLGKAALVWGFLAGSWSVSGRAAIGSKMAGAEHVPPGGGVLLAANHLSIFDTLLIPWVNIAKVRLEVVWAPAKAELFDIPCTESHHCQLGGFPRAARRP